jgi:hypothetical protein
VVSRLIGKLLLTCLQLSLERLIKKDNRKVYYPWHSQANRQ